MALARSCFRKAGRLLHDLGPGDDQLITGISLAYKGRHPSWDRWRRSPRSYLSHGRQALIW